MQDPFSQQDTEMEEASPSISFPHVRQLIQVYKVRNVINTGERKNKTGRGQGEVKGSPRPTLNVPQDFTPPPPSQSTSFLSVAVTCCCCSDEQLILSPPSTLSSL